MTVEELIEARKLLERQIENAISLFVVDTHIIPAGVDIDINKVCVFSGDCRYAGSKVHVSIEV